MQEWSALQMKRRSFPNEGAVMAVSGNELRKAEAGSTKETKRLSGLLFGGPARLRQMSKIFCLLLVCGCLPAQLHAEDNIFNSADARRQEISRISEEGKLFVTAPVDPYLVPTAVVAGAFALTYAFDKDIRSKVAGMHSGTLRSLTDAGSLAGNPFIHIGAAAAIYGAAAVADSPRYMLLGQQLGEALFLADGSTLVLKQAVGRGRPATGDGNADFRPFQFKTDYDSLPSMHTASSFAVAHVLASKTESVPAKVLYYAAASFVGFSRLYQDKHWTSDLIIGAAIGELAGNSVTRYYGLKKSAWTVAPLAIEGTPALAVVGKF
jgi:membrane-associated phospholipid phosphatase